jgi:signal transduction histidine kinase
MVVALEIMAEEASRVSPPEQHARQMLDRSVFGMQRLVTDLHDAARIGSGRFVVHPKAMDLVAVCRQVLLDQRLAASEHDVTLEAPDRIEGMWDELRMRQLLANLVSNAIKYSPEGGMVRVTIAEDGGEARVAVSDEGVGIDPEGLPRLFQPFTRLSTEARVDGTGLGLYIAKAIVEAHGGTIEVRSAVGRGTTFTVTLPIHRPIHPPVGALVAARD